jgi:hypothetical protein
VIGVVRWKGVFTLDNHDTVLDEGDSEASIGERHDDDNVDVKVWTWKWLDQMSMGVERMSSSGEWA